MSLLREIQDAAIDSNTGLAVLLRKCKVLAARLGSSEFKQWVENELSGYDDIQSLPDYRILHVNSKGHFSGPFQSGLRNADIPLLCMPKEYREALSHSYLNQSVAAMEYLIGSKSGLLQEPWNPDLVAYVGQNIYSGMNCIQAWKVIPKSSIVEALDTVRNRVLNFVLEIEAEAPDAGEAPANSNPVPQDKVHHIFNTYITGNVQNMATGSTYQNQGEFIMSQSKGNVNISDVQGNVSGITVAGKNQAMTGVIIGIISGSVANTINQLPTSPDLNSPGIKELLTQLQAAIETESELPDEDKAEALEQVKTLAESGQKPEDNDLQKAAKTSIKILKGTVASLPDAAKLAEACAKLLPAIATLLALL
jgi:hypothetical protein